MTTTAFLDAYLREEAAAREWLLSGGLARLSAGACMLEFKNATPARRGP